MLRRLSTTFKWTAGRALRNTVQLKSRCWKSFSFGWYEAFETHSNLRLGRAPPTRPSSFHGFEKPFRLDVMQPSNNIQVYGWSALANIFCHGPADFAALKNRFGFMLCRLWTTFKWTAGFAFSNTVQLILRCWSSFSAACYEGFQKQSILRQGRVPPNTAQFCSRCWRIFLAGCYAAI